MIFLKKVFILSLFLGTFLHAYSSELFQTLGYSATYEEALNKSKIDNKPMMLVISTKTCPWCRKLENKVLRREIINNVVQQNFVALALEQNDDVYPKKFRPQVVPTIIFVNPTDEKIFYKSYGYKTKNELQTILKVADMKFKKLSK